MIKLLTSLLLSCALLSAQSPLPRVPGFNLGLPNGAYVNLGFFHGKPALVIFAVGPMDILTIYKTAGLPLGTRIINPVVVRVSFIENRPCGLSGGLKLHTQGYMPPWPGGFVGGVGNNPGMQTVNVWHHLDVRDSGSSTWRMDYGNTSGCGPTVNAPEISMFLIGI